MLHVYVHGEEVEETVPLGKEKEKFQWTSDSQTVSAVPRPVLLFVVLEHQRWLIYRISYPHRMIDLDSATQNELNQIIMNFSLDSFVQLPIFSQKINK